MLMDEFSIETRAQNIFDRKTKEYFSEVLSSYQHGNFLVITDLGECIICWKMKLSSIMLDLKT